MTFLPIPGHIGTHDDQPVPLRIHNLAAFVVTRDPMDTHLFSGHVPCVVVSAEEWAAREAVCAAAIAAENARDALRESDMAPEATIRSVMDAAQVVNLAASALRAETIGLRTLLAGALIQKAA